MGRERVKSLNSELTFKTEKNDNANNNNKRRKKKNDNDDKQNEGRGKNFQIENWR